MTNLQRLGVKRLDICIPIFIHLIYSTSDTFVYRSFVPFFFIQVSGWLNQRRDVVFVRLNSVY